MAIDPRWLQLTQMVQLLNSTPLGEVIGKRQLYRHPERVGLRITAAGDVGKADRKRPAKLSITHKFRAKGETKMDIRQPRQSTMLPGGESCARAK